jgi:hypothetical protein
MRNRTAALGVLALASSPLLGLSCSYIPGLNGGGGGGGIKTSDITVIELEPNDLGTTPDTLRMGQPVRGDLLRDGDVDWFILRIVPGSTVKIELWGTRLDQASWDAAGTVPHLTVFFPDPDTKLLEHSFDNGWTFGSLDFEVPAYRMPANGTFIWIKLEPDQAATRTHGGRYVLRASDVSFGPGQHENESPFDIGDNDTPGTAQPMVPGVLNGYHRDANDDCYSITVDGPTVLRAEVLAMRDGAPTGAPDYWDPLLRLFDKDGTTILKENDDAFLLDPAFQFAVPTAGRYVIMVSQSPTSQFNGQYRLLLSTAPATGIQETEPNENFASANEFAYGQNVAGTIGPGEDDWFKFTGTAGDMVRLQVFDKNNSVSATEAVSVTLVGSDGATPLPFHEGPLFQVLTTILPQSGTTYVHVQPDPAATGPTTYRLELRRFKASTFETEPNDTIAEAKAFPAGGASGIIGAPGDVDLYRFTAESHQIVTFDVFASNTPTGTDQQSEYAGHGSALAPLLTIRDENGAVLSQTTSLPANGIYGESISDGLPTCAVAFVAPDSTHTFYIEVAAADGTGGPDHTYVLVKR